MEARVALVKQERSRMAAELEAQGRKPQPTEGSFLGIRADDQLLAQLVDAFDAAGIMVLAYQGDGVRITFADPDSNNRLLRLLAVPRGPDNFLTFFSFRSTYKPENSPWNNKQRRLPVPSARP